MYNNQECYLILLRDITELELLQKARQNVYLMKMLNATVSHDMVGPLQNILQFTDHMQTHTLNNEQMVHMMHNITDCAKFVFCRMKDLLDQNLIEHNIFVPIQALFSPIQAITQIKNIIQNSMRYFFDVNVTLSFDIDPD